MAHWGMVQVDGSPPTSTHHRDEIISNENRGKQVHDTDMHSVTVHYISILESLISTLGPLE